MGADPPILMGGDPRTFLMTFLDPPVEADPCERSRACPTSMGDRSGPSVRLGDHWPGRT